MAQPPSPGILTLVRHGHAEWPAYVGRDFDRPLTPRGTDEALATARAIHAAALRPSILLSSPARLSRETAEILARELGLPAESLHFESPLYNASADGLEAAVRDAASHLAHVMLVAHNPGISEFARRLMNDAALAPLPPAGWVTGRR